MRSISLTCTDVEARVQRASHERFPNTELELVTGVLGTCERITAPLDCRQDRQNRFELSRFHTSIRPSFCRITHPPVLIFFFFSFFAVVSFSDADACKCTCGFNFVSAVGLLLIV